MNGDGERASITMGLGSSKDRVGQLVAAGKSRLDHEEKSAEERYALMMASAPETLDFVLESTLSCLESCASFLEADLMLAFKRDPVRVQQRLWKTTEKVLSEPIDGAEWQWFKQYLLRSSVWFMRTADDDEALFEEMFRIASKLTANVNESMDGIYKHMMKHDDWNKVLAIREQTFVSRQDHQDVGLLREKCIVDLQERKVTEVDEEGVQKLKNYVETNSAVSNLSFVARKINEPFQDAVQRVIGQFGVFRAGPIKTIDRCVFKIENEYMDTDYKFPRAAKLLDIVRCSITCNTIPRLLEAYHKLLNHVAKKSTKMTKARVKNGFLRENDNGYRDIKVNVIFETDDGTKMICEIQFIYGQNLNEKKRSHRYYHLTRERAYYEGVIQKEGGSVLNPEMFEPVLSVKDEVETGVSTEAYKKCAVNSRLKMLFMKPLDTSLVCVDMVEKKVIFKTPAYQYGYHTFHWIKFNEQQLLSVQSSKNIIKFFEVSNDEKTFTEDESLRMTLVDSDEINFCEFDKKMENVYLVKNKKILEQRTVPRDQGLGMMRMANLAMFRNKQRYQVVMSLELGQSVGGQDKQLSVSGDGKWCAIATDSPYWFLIDTANRKQNTLMCKVLISSYAPCFIGGGSEFIAIGGLKQMEIWDVASRSLVQHITGIGSGVNCTFSVGNILAVGSNDKVLSLYDVEKWEVIYSKKFKLNPKSLHLTANQKYLTVAGYGGEQCVVIKLFD